MATEEFNFTSEERRLIHSFDDNGRWIRCLPCYEYARTLKKGSNNANADYSLVELRNPFKLSRWNGRNGHCDNKYHKECLAMFDETDEKKRKLHPKSSIVAPSILNHFKKIPKKQKVICDTKKQKGIQLYCNGLFPMKALTEKTSSGDMLRNALRLKDKFFNQERSDKYIVKKIEKTNILSLFSKKCIPVSTTEEPNGPKNRFGNKTAVGFRCVYCHEGNQGNAKVLFNKRRALLKTGEMWSSVEKILGGEIPYDQGIINTVKLVCKTPTRGLNEAGLAAFRDLSIMNNVLARSQTAAKQDTKGNSHLFVLH